MKTKQNIIILIFIILGFNSSIIAQVKPEVKLTGGDKNPSLKSQIEATLEMILLEINRVQKGTGDISPLKAVFTEDAFDLFSEYVSKNKPYTARKNYSPQMISKVSDNTFDVRSIGVKINIGDTESSEVQNLVFSFSPKGIVTSVRVVLTNYDYHTLLSAAESSYDSAGREIILDFIERFRMAYNTKDIKFLDKVFSDDALIITGSLIKEKSSNNEMLNKSFLSRSKIQLVQQTKEEYLDKLINSVFKSNKFLNIRFEDLKIIRHEKYRHIYGVTCWQIWNSSNYSDKGYLFLMMDFKDIAQPVIHVRTWQPNAFDEDSSFISLYDFDIVAY